MDLTVKKGLRRIGNWIKEHKKRCIGLLVLIAVIISAIGIRRSLMDRKVMAAETLPMETTTVERRTLTNSISATGAIESQKKKEISSTLANVEVAAVHVEVGDEVQEGDVLVELDTTDIEESLAQAREELSVAQAQNSLNLKSAERELESTKTNIDYQTASDDQKVAQAEQAVNSAEAKVSETSAQYQEAVNNTDTAKTALDQASENNAAAAEIENLTKVYNDAFSVEKAAKEAYENALNSLSSAQNNYETAVNDRAKSYESNVSNLEGKEDSLTNTKLSSTTSLSKQEEQVETYEEQLEKAVITAPCSGTVTTINVEEGDIYTGNTIATVEDVSGFVVSAEIDEYDISKIEKGMQAVIKTDATGTRELEGEVTFVSPTPTTSSDSENNGMTSSSADTAYEIQVTIRTSAEELRIGMTAKLSIVLESRENVLAVPYDAVQENEQGQTVIYVLDGSTASLLPEESESAIQDMDPPENRKKDTEALSEEELQTEKDKVPESSGENTENGQLPRNTGTNRKEIVVTTGLETDYYIEVEGEGLAEGMQVITPTYASTTNGSSDSSMPNMGGMMGGGMPMGR